MKKVPRPAEAGKHFVLIDTAQAAAHKLAEQILTGTAAREEDCRNDELAPLSKRFVARFPGSVAECCPADYYRPGSWHRRLAE